MLKTEAYELAENTFICSLFLYICRKREITGIPFIGNNKSNENI